MATTIECSGITVVSWLERFQHIVDVLPAFSEMCWFTVSLMLFMVLGPFAAPIAVYALFNLDSEHRGLAEPDSVE